MNIKKTIKELIDNGYVVLSNNELIFTSKITLELNGISVQKEKPKAKSVISTDQNKEIWNKFIVDANIPHRVKSPTGDVYTVRQYNLAAVKKLISILKTPNISYERLVKSTNNYYNTVTYKNTLSNYLLKEIWEGEYQHFNPNKEQYQVGENRFEE